MIIKVPLNILIHFMGKGDKKLLSSHKSFGTFSIEKDIPYIDDGSQLHKLDILRPVLNHENGVVLFYIHGGAYVYGAKELNQIFTSWFVNQGFTVISINYRKTDISEHVEFKQQLQDVYAALNFIYDNRHVFSLPMDKFCLMGDSAGGHLCLMLDVLFHSEEARQYYGIAHLPNINIRCLALNSTMYDYPALVPFGLKYVSKRSLQRVLGSDCFDDEYMKKNSPCYYINNGVKISPTFNSTAYHDNFIFQSLKFHNDAQKLDLDLTHYLEASPRKEVGHIFNHFIYDEEGLKCNNAMVKFILSHCDIE